MSKVVKTVSLDTQRDADLLAWLDAQPNQSEAVRVALRAYLDGAVTLGDVYRAVKRLERKIEAGVIVNPPGAPLSGDAPGTEEAAANLERLGL